MKLSFSNLLGAIPRGVHTVHNVTNTGVLIKKEDRRNIKTSELLPLASDAQEGGKYKFWFFKTNGQLGSKFKAVMTYI